jgi:pimeloyl-ACP methyl ester carboxylesterase
MTHLVLVATFLHSPLQPWLAPFGSLARPALFTRPPPAFAVRALLAAWDADASLVATLRDAMATLPPAVAAARARAALGANEGATLARVTVPTLWLRASADWLLRPGHVDGVRDALPAAHIAAVQGPHMILQRRPRECLDAIARFLATPGEAT